MFDPLYNAFGAGLAFFYALVPNLGVAIILLTITVMLVLFPLTAKSARSMLSMQRLQPEIKKLQAKYKGDRQKLNEEMMQLYQEHKVNPLGGCLPLLVQLPVFFALFHVLRNVKGTTPLGSALHTAVEAADKAGHGLKFLSMDLALKATDTHSSLTAALPYFILVGLVVLTGYIQSRQTQRNTPPGADNRMLMIGKVLPIVFGVFSLNFPSGLVLYFFVSNLWRVGQQELIMRKIAPRDHLKKPANGAVDVKSAPAKPAPTEAEPDEKPALEQPTGRAPAKRAQGGDERASVRGVLRGLFQPPPPKDETTGPAQAKAETPAPKPAASKQPAGSRSASNRGGQTRRRRRRSSNKKRKR